MKVDELRIAELGDIHLGHPNTPTVDIIANLERAFPDTAETGELDIIILAGDIFDRLLTFPDTNVVEIKHWVNRFLRMCKRRDILVRVLEGTPSHDWKQSQIFEHINDIGGIDCDLVYQDTLCIEHIERFGIDVLYVPDEWEFETDDTWQQVEELLRLRGIDQVDFCVMHGAFHYQLPAHVQSPRHVEERYLRITRHYIFIGHIHNHSMFERILAAGSFDRLRHNEEEAKGHLRVIVRKHGEDEIHFIENEGARKYVTVNCEGIPLEEALQRITETCEALPDGSAVRVQAGREDAIIADLDTLKDKYPSMDWSTKISTKSMNTEEMLNTLRSKYKGLEIRSDNIVDLVLERIAVNMGVEDSDVIARCRELLIEVA